MKRDTSNFIVAVVVAYALALAALTARGVTTNDYTYTGPGLTGINASWPLPTELMSLSGWQSIQQLRQAMLNFATNAATGQHYLDGSHKTGFVTSAMIPSNAITRAHFESNVTAQLLATNGYAQLPFGPVVQWCWTSAGSKTSSIWNLSWPTTFSNGCFGAWATAVAGDNNFSWFSDPPATWSSNEWLHAQATSWSRSNVVGTLRCSGTFTASHDNRVCVIGLGW